MIQTFNCGVGFCLITNKKNLKKLKNTFQKNTNLMKLVLYREVKRRLIYLIFKMVKKNTCVFISGKGTNLNNLIIKSRIYNFPIKIKLVISNNRKAPGIDIAKKNSIPVYIINTKSRSLKIRF